MFPPGGISAANLNDSTSLGWWDANLVNWRALILPHLEQGPLYNAANFSQAGLGTRFAVDQGAGYTIWLKVTNTWLCPSDGTNGGGLRPFGGPDGQFPIARPIDPTTGQPVTVVPVANYAGSFGDNYCGGPLCNGLPWESLPAHQPACRQASNRLAGLLGDQHRFAGQLPRRPASRLLRLRDAPNRHHRERHRRDQQHLDRRRGNPFARRPTATSGTPTAAPPGLPCRSGGTRTRSRPPTPLASFSGRG